MRDEYEPRHAPGEILITPRREYADKPEFLQDLLSPWGYELVQQKGTKYLCKVPEGKEGTAYERLSTLGNYIVGAEFRDLRLEERVRNMRLARDRLSRLLTKPDMPNEEYSCLMETLQRYLEAAARS
ncbi:MAG: hypothetical protein ABIF40_03325 [archaeon]